MCIEREREREICISLSMYIYIYIYIDTCRFARVCPLHGTLVCW